MIARNRAMQESAAPSNGNGAEHRNGFLDPGPLYELTGILPTLKDGRPSARFMRRAREAGFGDDVLPREPLDTEQDIVIPRRFRRGTVALEAAHVYTDDAFGDEHRVGAEVGGFFQELFTRLGFRVEPWLFVDDVPSHNPKGREFDEREYRSAIAEHGYVPKRVQYESKLALQGQRLLNQLARKGRVRAGKGMYVLAGERFGNVSLGDGAEPSCALFDAALYVRKLRGAQYAVTVLPERFRGEQSNTRKILAEAGKDPQRVLSVYVDEAGRIGVPDAVDETGVAHLQLLPIAVRHFFAKGLSQGTLNGFVGYCNQHIFPSAQTPGAYPVRVHENVRALQYVR